MTRLIGVTLVTLMAAGFMAAADPIGDLRSRKLLVPVQGVTTRELRNSFADARERTRQHEAIDILAPRGTPVLAVEDGTIERLFPSVRGGLTIYQFDPSRTYAYYYAHLDRYQSGLKERDRVKRGQTIGFVGTTGNAPKDTPHLHFGIFVLTPEKHWWRGTALNPFDVWAAAGN
jgi:murein DD-endopeptidase MepM/ murein hydrolase activator NlpD